MGVVSSKDVRCDTDLAARINKADAVFLWRELLEKAEVEYEAQLRQQQLFELVRNLLSDEALGLSPKEISAGWLYDNYSFVHETLNHYFLLDVPPLKCCQHFEGSADTVHQHILWFGPGSSGMPIMSEEADTQTAIGGSPENAVSLEILFQFLRALKCSLHLSSHFSAQQLKKAADEKLGLDLGSRDGIERDVDSEGAQTVSHLLSVVFPCVFGAPNAFAAGDSKKICAGFNELRAVFWKYESVLLVGIEILVQQYNSESLVPTSKRELMGIRDFLRQRISRQSIYAVATMMS